MATVFTRRVIAYVIDFFVVSAFMWIASYFVYGMMTPKSVYNVYQYFPFVLPVLILLYFVICEKLFAASVGKSLMYLEVVSKNGARISWLQAIVRNLTKLYWFPIIFDWFVGRLLRTDRLFNNITRTVVVNER